MQTRFSIFSSKALLISTALVSLVWLSSAFATATSDPMPQLQPLPKHKKATNRIVHLITRNHYRRKSLDDSLSAAILDRYLESMDPNRNVFHAKDIASFQKYKKVFDDALRKEDLTAAYDIYNLFRKRVNERAAFALKTLNSKFDFTVDEKFRYDRSKAPWAKSTKELDEIWRKRVKNDYLSLKLAGKKHKDIVSTLSKRYKRLTRRNRQSKSEDVYQLFMNAYTLSIEPHTSYFSPRTSEDFQIHMSLKLEGIGAALGVENEYTVIRKIIPGGPAALSSKLGRDDKIVGVGQGKKGKIVDVIGWRLDDVVRLIRGKKGTVVRLQVLKKGAGVGGLASMITLVRDTIKLEEQAAKYNILKVGSGAKQKRIGVIKVPTFYRDFEALRKGDPNYRSSTRDVLKIIKKLRKEKISGIIIDLRGNGGGSLTEATTLTGLFIKSGPVVQWRNYLGAIEREDDIDPSIAYSGPLAVLVDKGSASASEIFAGAIQDYKRGIIIGEPTFGKGTVQSMLDLSGSNFSTYLPFGKKKEKLGQLKLTTAQFFRVNGESTQHRGVIPDITLPSMFGTDDQGESSFKNALPWDKIAPAKYSTTAYSKSAVQKAREKHLLRVKKDPGFKSFQMLSSLYKKIKDQKYISLLETKRKRELKFRESKQLEGENRMRSALGLKPVKKKGKKKNEDDEDVSAKIVLNEAANILLDYISEASPRATTKTAGTNK